MSQPVFLTAEWRKLAMANYVVDPALLARWLPANTELDFFDEKCFVSLVGFMFQDTRVMGIRIPFHQDFEEVNLRFYVRHKTAGEWRRGVVFIKEIVPRSAITFVANTIYKEHYQTLPMKHEWLTSPGELSVSYQWKLKKWHSIDVKAQNTAVMIGVGSEEEFITEHYWGYTRINPAKTSEYEVRHPRWEVYPVTQYSINTDFEIVYGREFTFLNDLQPHSVFLAEGSLIQVMNKSNR
jgi:uncharacterized protein YqjF (DUF2071 family)